jgi:hypothetical protein
MPLFDNNWETLGYYRGNIDFYLINTSLFGGWQNAMPQEIVTALSPRFDNPLACGNRAVPVTWFLRKVSPQGVTSLAENDPIAGAASVGAGCIEHQVHWPRIGGSNMPASKMAKQYQTKKLNGSGSEFFTAGGTVIIYSTWQPCLSCCNSLFSLARDHALDINLVVRFQRVYDLDINGPLADATLVIPRRGLILSNANPAPADRAVFVFHDNVAELRNLARRNNYLGAMTPIVSPDTQLSPHHNTALRTREHPGGEPCGNLDIIKARVTNARQEPHVKCIGCNQDLGFQPIGSGLPWTVRDNTQFCEGYVPAQHYAPRRLVM